MSRVVLQFINFVFLNKNYMLLVIRFTMFEELSNFRSNLKRVAEVLSRIFYTFGYL